ncbi:hypothetical protein [Shewanella acanthi]|uniref:hypothetical protein n=1 Tax=Shewanella acanthi TaxID=2864212 RepID=UPI001C659053|nr:hypothetical protein [Shewanella acanthi]MCH1929004.1 hypothetical protein [Shewanella shenzhenensis]QYJ79786.1 hypothetical protein K0H61_04995 [Shewanella acanthi]
MHLSNAERWTTLCKRQIDIIDKLSEKFPERKDNLHELTEGWRHLQHQVEVGERPIVHHEIK